MADIVEKPGADAAEKGKSIASAHFVGIGGAGMSGIALVLNKRGCKVTGSDLKSSHYVLELEDAGIDVTIGHDAATIDRVSLEVVVTSSAIPETSPVPRCCRTSPTTPLPWPLPVRTARPPRRP